MRWALLSLVVLPLAALAQVAPQPAPQPQAPAPRTPRAASLDGRALFAEKCAMCHGKGGMGTGLLARRVQPALLEERTDLDAEAVAVAARSGIGNMPAIPRGEANDAQLAAIAAWLARKR